ncbi:hypothetical protein [Sandaracinus amylolyticus]|uniref:Uncharacterized protein n=1 Tax=Sandaracinus amylolyticus TaxID=927083 RepID=A0A0F6YHT9_9BACT|nr:hypothetical protein [Sandaracinus amylolyticus]AKF05120.1 hypothetical protein DB32_002269 [Sandaracinus amylolyticus]
MATTYQRVPGMVHVDDPGERLRQQKLHSSKGIGIMTAMIAVLAVVIAVTMWMASHVAPEPEESEGFAHEELDVPADRVRDPRAIE